MGLPRRRQNVKKYKNYKSYKKWLREDFEYRCCYCSIHENDYGGYWHFHVDHYRPKGLPCFAHLITDYSNLLYSCDQCNVLKGDIWPSDNPLVDGCGWLDPCEHDLRKHYYYAYENGDFRLITVTIVGRWMARVLGLDQLPRMTLRRDLVEDERVDLELYDTLGKLLEHSQKKYEERSTDEQLVEINLIQQALSKLRNRIEKKYEPKPFVSVHRRSGDIL